MGERQFLAATYVAAAKYQLEGLEDKIYREMEDIVTKHKLSRGESEQLNDFLRAVEIVAAGCTREDCRMRALVVDYCFWNLSALTNGGTEPFSTLIDNSDLDAEMFARLISDRTLSPMEGSWFSDGKWHPDAIPLCACCSRQYPKRLIATNRDEESWTCPSCQNKDTPVVMQEIDGFNFISHLDVSYFLRLLLHWGSTECANYSASTRDSCFEWQFSPIAAR